MIAHFIRNAHNVVHGNLRLPVSRVCKHAFAVYIARRVNARHIGAHVRIGHNRTAFQCNANPFKPKLRRIRTPANRKQDLVRCNQNSLALLLIAHAGFRNFRYPRAKQEAHAPFS